MSSHIENKSQEQEASYDLDPFKSTVAMSCGGVLSFVDGKFVIVEDHGPLSTNNDRLIEAASKCVLYANISLQHSLQLLNQGEKKFADHAKMAQQIVSICSALSQMAKFKSSHLLKLASIAKDMCKNCEQLSRQFDSHSESLALGDACKSCIKECDLLLVRAQFAVV